MHATFDILDRIVNHFPKYFVKFFSYNLIFTCTAFTINILFYTNKTTASLRFQSLFFFYTYVDITNSDEMVENLDSFPNEAQFFKPYLTLADDYVLKNIYNFGKCIVSTEGENKRDTVYSK